MPFCPNPNCDHRQRLGEPAEFLAEVATCSDCGSMLSETRPNFVDVVAEPKNIMTLNAERWTCPQCGSANRDDLSLCSCGYDFNRPINADQLEEKNVAAAFERDPVQDPESLEQQRELPLRFHGSALEYFKIWIVNLCLTLLTLGIFSAWAKVRKKRYFYSHTTVDGTPFQYLGQPGTIGVRL
jgi:hypothetical protein